jgi:MFS family permease
VRTVPYMLAFAFAPLLFGFISDLLGARHASAVASRANGVALSYTFLIMLVPTAIAGLSLLWAVRTYPRDVATAAASSAAARPELSPERAGG